MSRNGISPGNLGLIATEGAGSTGPGDPYLSRFPDIYSNVSVRSIVRPHLLGRYFNASNAIENHNMIRQSDLSLEKYWVNRNIRINVRETR